MHLDDTAHILGSAEFFTICNLEQRRMLAFASERVRLNEDEVLFKAGDVTPGAYLLVSGSLVSRQGEAKKTTEFPVDQPGTLIAQLALLTKQKRRATLTCVKPAELLLITRSSFLKLLDQFPEVGHRAKEMIRNDIGKYVTALKEVKPLKQSRR